jgi:hypothetical protein
MPPTVKGRAKIKQKTEEEFFSSGSDSAASAPASVLTFLSGKYAHGQAVGDSSLSETQNATTQPADKPLTR